MNHLHKKGVLCPNIISDNDGIALQEIAGKSAIITSFLKGEELSTITTDACRQVGEVTAKLHLAVNDFTQKRPNTLGLNGWIDLFEKTASHMDTDLKAFIHNELQYQKTNISHDLPSGIIHADLFTDNIFFNGDKFSGVIDFYFSCTDSFAYDLAITMTAWCFTDNFDNLNIEMAKSMIEGYESVRRLSLDEKQSFQTLCRGACVRFMMTRYFDKINTVAYANVVLKDHTEYRRKLSFYQTHNLKTLGIII